MKRNSIFTLLAFLLLNSIIIPTFGQKTACKKEAKAAAHPLPKFNYQCSGRDEEDETILTKPHRLKVLNSFIKSLEAFTFADWWKTPAKDLSACYSRKTATPGYEIPVYEVFGNSNLRVLKVADPCYQTYYGGANIFLLNRKNDKIYVSELWDGFFNRNPEIWVNLAPLEKEPVVEIALATSGPGSPFYTSYFFAVNPRTNRAAPKNIFLDPDQKRTNAISSMMDMTGDKTIDHPIWVIKKGRLAGSFYLLEDESSDGTFTKRTLRWNGKFYQ
jgi:hypothetical protein